MKFSLKDLIIGYRKEGLSFREIAEKTHASEDYCRTVCSRANIHIEQNPSDSTKGVCRFCGKQLVNTPGAKPKKYCSDLCRYKYHDKMRKAYVRICEHCGQEVVSYGYPQKHFCSRGCRTAASRKE